MRFSLPELLKTRAGLAVFFGSAAAELAVPGIAAYCVAKAAEEHLARQLAAEAPWITTFAYRPGIVDTDMQSEARKAQGGAAESLHREFRGYQERRRTYISGSCSSGARQIDTSGSQQVPRQDN